VPSKTKRAHSLSLSYLHCSYTRGIYQNWSPTAAVRSSVASSQRAAFDTTVCPHSSCQEDCSCLVCNYRELNLTTFPAETRTSCHPFRLRPVHTLGLSVSSHLTTNRRKLHRARIKNRYRLTLHTAAHLPPPIQTQLLRLITHPSPQPSLRLPRHPAVAVALPHHAHHPPPQIQSSAKLPLRGSFSVSTPRALPKASLPSAGRQTSSVTMRTCMLGAPWNIIVLRKGV
jgi:hypothetical protein